MTTKYRVGTTSYIIPADLLPNLEHLAGTVADIELILFEVDDGPSNLPDGELIGRMRQLSADHDLTYTVHLPLDITLGDIDTPEHPSMRKASAVVERMRAVDPHAYVVHAEGKDVLAGETDPSAWCHRTTEALKRLADVAGGADLLAVENLEGYPLDFLDPVFEAADVSACVDIGHLWLEKHDAMAYLERRIHRTRVIHLHGVGTRDHQSLVHTPTEDVDRLREALERHRYSGVVTLEVFKQEDLDSSLDVFLAAPHSATAPSHANV